MTVLWGVNPKQLTLQELEDLVDECVGSMDRAKMPTCSACQCAHIDPDVVRIDEDEELAS